ncbi:hypothetical protein EYF80_022278 [Liparis tanakae]|uniref:Uncharacterized protein n=1 Tax=Liparis tanakae TaxID=230148 RepID=A0A4Z2HRN4_9TELE|nr:hypothetical protein EYF80_022278 [Liparis tanakae]
MSITGPLKNVTGGLDEKKPGGNAGIKLTRDVSEYDFLRVPPDSLQKPSRPGRLSLWRRSGRTQQPEQSREVRPNHFSSPVAIVFLRSGPDISSSPRSCEQRGPTTGCGDVIKREDRCAPPTAQYPQYTFGTFMGGTGHTGVASKCSSFPP